MPFCGNCGTKLQENERFCGNCGASVQAQFAQPAVFAAQPTQPATFGQPAPAGYGSPMAAGAPVQPAPKQSKAGVIAIGAAAVLIIAAVILVLASSIFASPEKKMRAKSEQFFNSIAAGNLERMLDCVDPKAVQMIRKTLDQLMALTGKGDELLESLAKSFFQMAADNISDLSGIQSVLDIKRISIVSFETDYEKGDKDVDIVAVIEVRLANGKEKKLYMEYEMVEYENDWYIAT